MKRADISKRILHCLAWTCFLLSVVQCSGRKNAMLGIADGKLTPCPDSPNCVSSQSKDQHHYIEPLHFTGPLEASRKKLIKILDSMQRVKIIRETNNYLHVTVTSRFFRFVDDMEFYFVEDPPVIHIRSASRVGYSDLGVNRKRIEKIRKAMAKNI